MEEIKLLFELLESFKSPSYNELPEIDLYMDQVLTYIKKHLPPTKPNDKDTLTGSMINNYVKDHVIKNPVDKKYDKEAIAALIMVANLKRVLPISDIKSVFKDSDIAALYEIYTRQLSDNISHLIKNNQLTKVTNIDLKEIALALSVDASIKSYIAHMILTNNQVEPVKEKKKKESKDKEKSVQA